MYTSNGGHMNPMPTMYGSHAPKVSRLRVQTTGTYNQQYHRPYEPNLYGPHGTQMLDSLSEMMIRQNNKFTPGNFVSPATSLVTQSATPEAPIFVPNGWEERKLRFYLELEVVDLAGNKSMVTYTGFTENADLSFGNFFDPNMRFIVTGSDTLRAIQRVYGDGQRTYSWEVADSSQILVNQNFSQPGNGAFGSQQIYSMQPDKVFENWENNAFASVDSNDYPGGAPIFRDGRVQLTGSPTKAKRVHNLAPSYTRDILNAYVTTALTANDGQMDHTEMMIECAARSRPSSVDQDVFFMALKNLRRQRSGGYMTIDNSFTYEELCALDPNTPNQINPPDSIRNIEGLASVGSGCGWQGSDRQTQTASILAQSLPSYMSRCGLYGVKFHSTNIGTLDNQCVTALDDWAGPGQGADMRGALDAFRMMLDTEMFPSITLGGVLGYHLRGTVDRLGETWLHLSLNGEPEITFVSPTFADALMTPLATRDYGRVSSVTNSIGEISNRFWENRGGRESDSLSGTIRV